MTRGDIIKELKQYFNIKELVCPHTLKEWKEKSWQFLTTEILHTLLVIRRDILKVPLVCNTSTLTQRGLRCNLCEVVKNKTMNNILYLSSHHNGLGLDLSSPKMSAENMRKLIKQNADLLPYPIRMENDVNWLHIDCYDNCDGHKINFFDP